MVAATQKYLNKIIRAETGVKENCVKSTLEVELIRLKIVVVAIRQKSDTLCKINDWVMYWRMLDTKNWKSTTRLLFNISFFARTQNHIPISPIDWSFDCFHSLPRMPEQGIISCDWQTAHTPYRHQIAVDGKPMYHKFDSCVRLHSRALQNEE